MSTAINQAMVSTLFPTTGVKSLLSGKAEPGVTSFLDSSDVFTNYYINQPAVKLNLSDGLGAFINENVTDENIKASLLADLAAIEKFSALFDDKDDGSISSALLGNGKASTGLLNLLA